MLKYSLVPFRCSCIKSHSGCYYKKKKDLWKFTYLPNPALHISGDLFCLQYLPREALITWFRRTCLTTGLFQSIDGLLGQSPESIRSDDRNHNMRVICHEVKLTIHKSALMWRIVTLFNLEMSLVVKTKLETNVSQLGKYLALFPFDFEEKLWQSGSVIRLLE